MNNENELKKSDNIQIGNKKNTLTLIFSVLTIIIAIFSFNQSNLALNYTKKINKAAISLIRVDIKSQKEDTTYFVEFTFVFKNTGNESVIVDNYQTFAKDLMLEDEKLGEKRRILNTMFPGGIFKMTVKRSYTGINSEATESEILESLLTELYMVLHIDYSNDNMSQSENFYQNYTGGSDVHYTNLEDYKKIEQYLPSEFRLKNKIP